MRITILALAAFLAAGTAASAATPPPAAHPAPAPVPVDLRKVTPRQLAPKVKLHTEFVVEVNKLGQVTRVRSGRSCPDLRFNAQTYGNALQAFIRTPDGRAISGVYRLTYDYDPKTQKVRRDVALLWAGGVNANAEGAATQMMKLAAKQAARDRAKQATAPPAPQPAPTFNSARLPDLPEVMQTPHR